MWFLLAPAFAAPPTPADAPETESETGPAGRPIRYRDREEVDFEQGLSLEGQLVGPSIAALSEAARPGFNPLTPIRAHWAPEMKASIDEIR